MDNSKDYNEEPVFYCKNCLSLRIKTVRTDVDLDYCDECGSTNIDKAHIEHWQDLYKQRYGFDFLTKKLYKNGRD